MLKRNVSSNVASCGQGMALSPVHAVPLGLLGRRRQVWDEMNQQRARNKLRAEDQGPVERRRWTPERTPEPYEPRSLLPAINRPGQTPELTPEQR